MQIIIPLIESQQDNIELRYCLRSIQKYLTGVTGVTIIGYLPAWTRNISHIPFPAAVNTEWKEKNIYDKLCQVKGRFLYMNDDHYLLREYNARKFPYYYEDTLKERMQKCSVRNVYLHTIKNTIEITGIKQFFDIHCPILLDRDFLSAKINWNKEFGYCLKTLYASWDKQFIPATDLKLSASFDENQIRSLLRDREWFSTNEAAWNEPMIKVMDELYSLKSNYEK